MVLFLRGFFTLVLGGLLVITIRAGIECPLLSVPSPIASHPWFVATLADAYAGLAIAFAWICFKEASWVSRFAWLVATLLLGHVAVLSYVVGELFRTDRAAPASQILTVRRDGPGWLGIALAVGGVVLITVAMPAS
jgi:hypothetical protein